MSQCHKTSKLARHSTYYIDKFIGLNCSADLLGHKMFPNAKEITESYGMFEATRRLYPEIKHEDTNVTCIVIGDGVRPRTAALFAHMTRWNCWSIDPGLRIKGRDCTIERLKQFPRKVQECRCETIEGNVLIVCPHSHSPPEDCFRFRGTLSTFLLAMPCCVKYNLSSPIIEYEDKFVWSPCNLIRGWKL